MTPADSSPAKGWRRGTRRWAIGGIAALAGLLLLGLAPATPWHQPPSTEAQTICGKHYVAGGDDVPAGNTISSSETYPSHLIADHMAKLGWCVYNTAQNGTTSSTYNSGGQLATTWNRQPDLITLSVGEQDTPIVNAIKSCFDSIKKHDFTSANSCALAAQANSAAFTNLTSNLTTTLQQYKMIMAGRPQLVVAVVGYPNPYPQSSSVSSLITQLCTSTEDTITPCSTRWAQLLPVLTTLDSIVQKINTTLANAVQPFNTGYQGRFVFVNPYSNFRSHAMKMDVTLKLDTVCHLCGTQATYNDKHSSEKNLGASTPWFKAGSDGTDTPFYLQPADQLIDPPVVLMQESQTTSGMGVYPNDAGNKCISDMVWEAVKWKLSVPEPLNSNICQ
jgi:lysophospholipase L1-like esterase